MSACQFATGHTNSENPDEWARACACGLYEWLDPEEKAALLEDFADWYGDGLPR